MYHTHSTDAIYVPAWTTCTILHNKATKIPYLGPGIQQMHYYSTAWNDSSSSK